ncbi:MAG: response regulator [Proteobacteria bacterium]|nr:response regulator [Pseudomonadota bacterium]
MRKNGERVWVAWTHKPVYDPAGRLTEILCVGNDISDRVRAEEAVRISERKYRDLLDNIDELVFSLDMSGRITYVSPACRTMMGLQPDLIAGHHFSELVHPADLPGLEKAYQDALNGQVYPGEYRLLTREGRCRWVRAYSKLIMSGNRITGIQGVLSDITERRQAEEALEAYQQNLETLIEERTRGLARANEELQREIQEHQQTEAALRQSEENTRFWADAVRQSNQSFVAMHPDGRFLACNPAFSELSGYTEAELNIDITAGEMTGPECIEPEQESLRRLNRTGRPQRYEKEIILKNGSRLPIEVYINAHRGPDGALLHYNAFVSDISARNRAELELKEAKEAAEAANRAKSDFLASMSHEIRTPMNGIIGMTELALARDLEPEQRWEYLEMVKVSAEALLTLLNDILDFSKIEAGKLQIEAIDFNLRDSLGDMIKMLAVQAHDKGLELAYHVPPEVPDALVGDPGRLRQIIINLIGNAIKFTYQGEVVLAAEIESRDENGVRLHFTVQDTGIGIPLEKQPLILAPFVQAEDSTTRQYGGTGLGLTISSRLIEMMGGRLDLDSQSGQGSTFHFRLDFPISRNPEAWLIPTHQRELKNMPVLIVDDNPTNRRILEEMVRNWGMRPTVAADGPTALEAIERAGGAGQRFPLMLIDVNMPKMSGFELARQIMASPDAASSALIMLTSTGQRGDAALCRELGLAGYLTKPVKQSDLLESVQIALGASAEDGEGSRPLVTRHYLRETQRSLKVLLAEDNPVNQMLVVHMLERRGHVVTVANNGREALRALHNQRFDLALMDIQMPEMDGLAASRTIRAREKSTGEHLPIVALTARAMQGDREECLNAGMDAYVTKPIRADELFRNIDRLCFNGQSAPLPDKSPVEPIPTTIFNFADFSDRISDDSDILEEIINLFLHDLPRRLSAVSSALASNDESKITSTAHCLKGMCANISALSATEAAARLEEIGRSGNLESAREAFADLKTEIDRLETVLTRYRPAVQSLT